MKNEFAVEVVDPAVALRDPNFVDDWNKLLVKHNTINGMFASPDWVAHLIRDGSTNVRIWCIRNPAGSLAGVVPAKIGEYALQFAVSHRVLWTKKLNAAHILGSVPAIPESSELFNRVMKNILEEWKQCCCIYFDALPTDSCHWRFLTNDRSMLDALFYVVDGPRPWHLLELKSSFDAYLSELTAKSRANFRRSARQAANGNSGPATIRCFVDASEAREFLEGAAQVAHHSWQEKEFGKRINVDDRTVASFADLAERGIMRCYLLNFGATPVAFVVGYQFSDVFHYSEIAYREDMNALSPGKVLLYHVVEDLHSHKVSKTLNFGVGDASYKRRYGNLQRSDASCLIMRRGAVNLAVKTSHQILSTSIDAIKKIIRRRVTK